MRQSTLAAHTISDEPKWRRRKAERPTEILDAALEVFSARGVSASTLEDVAAAAGVRRTTIYLYFKNKEMLFDELTHTFLPTMPDHHVLKAELAALPIVEQYRRLATIAGAAITERRAASVLRLVFAEARNHPDIARAYRVAFAQQFLPPLVAVVSRGMAEGRFRCKDATQAARMTLSVPMFMAMWGAAGGVQTFGTDAPWDVPSYLVENIDLFTSGLAAVL